MGRVHLPDLDRAEGQQPLDGAHGVDKALAPNRVERRQHRLGELVAALVEQRALGAAAPRSAVATRMRRSERLGSTRTRPAVSSERSSRLAWPGVQSEAGTERADLAALRADLPQHARLAERAVEGQEAVAERADPLRDGSVEAPDLVTAAAGIV